MIIMNFRTKKNGTLIRKKTEIDYYTLYIGVRFGFSNPTGIDN